MSLLMDALKKAEKARQEKAAGEARAEQPEAGPGLSLDPMEPAPPAGGEDGALAPATEPPADDLPFELEPAAEGELDDDLLDADSSATLPSIKAAQASVDDYFDGTRSVSVSMEQVRTALEEEDTAERARPEGDTAARRSARTVLDSAIERPPRRVGRTLAYLVLVLVVLGGLGAGGWAYWQSLNGRPGLLAGEPRFPVPPTLPAAPEVAAASETPVPSPLPAAIEDQGPPLEQVVALAEPVAPRGDLTPQPEPPAAAVPAAGEAPASEVPLAADAQRQASVAAAGPAAQSPGGAGGVDGAGKATGLEAGFGDPEAVVENLARAIARAGGAAGPRIHIRRKAHANPTAAMLTQAYQAFLAGDLEGAGGTWHQVLERDPGSRDALLGLAALALRGGRPEEATIRYRQVLALDPGDSVARAALIELARDVDPVRAESSIKGLLEREPDAAWLHYSLGNLYAAQGRWAEAEEAYFAAYRGADANPDYAYNLAVSLDHLDQGASALGYYRRALELAGRGGATFASAAVSDRVRVLSSVEAAQ